jgi:hypothetical protein
MPETNWWNARDNEGFIFALAPAPATPEVPKPTSKQINDACDQLELISRILRVHWSDSVVADGQWVRGLQDRLQAIIGEICETTEEN